MNFEQKRKEFIELISSAFIFYIPLPAFLPLYIDKSF